MLGQMYSTILFIDVTSRPLEVNHELTNNIIIQKLKSSEEIVTFKSKDLTYAVISSLGKNLSSQSYDSYKIQML